MDAQRDGGQGGTRAVLTFLGGAGTVTGSRFLVTTDPAQVLLDCGLFQGLKALRKRNWSPFPIYPDTLDAIALTHAHLDHVGYLPALVRDGYDGPVFATAGTAALAGIILPDSGRLQEEDARHAARHGYSKHRPALPLYTEADARRALELFRTVPTGQRVELADGMAARFHHAGHILGASQIELCIDDGPTVWTTGDLGRPTQSLMLPPATLGDVDVLLVESTYGDRQHEPPDGGGSLLADVIERTDARGGVTVLPAFAVDRTELVLMELKRLREEGRLGDIPVFVDSPMALAALEVYRQALLSDPHVRPEARQGSDPFDPGHRSLRQSAEDSKGINDHMRGIIISASGMASGGRVLHHLLRRLPDRRNSVVLVGFQAPGTRGRSLLDGAAHVKIHGEYVPVRAEVVDVPGFSVHADQTEILTWLGSAGAPPGVTYVVHGEPDAADALRTAISRELGWNVVVPRQGERVRLRR